MTDTPENQPVEGAEILRLLRKIDAQARESHEILVEIQGVVRDAAPLLKSGPAKALRGAASVGDFLRGGKRDG